ncbi:hypothetical protein ANO14919_099390 [Xylariales sp. No.14919]|nr:hypothetical protein ANO14919_099390 [Xylariales sp. No.14919]
MIFAFISITLLALVALYYRASPGRRSQKLPEPPTVRTRVPIFGHIVCMFRYRKSYFQYLRDQSQLPIITLPLVRSTVYAVFSIPTIQSIQRQNEAFAFQPIQAWLSTTICGVSEEAYRILQRDMQQEHGQYGPIYSVMHGVLSPGDRLNEMNTVFVDRLCDYIRGIEPGTSIKLNEWVKHRITLAVTDTTYGPYNPFREIEVESAFWAFERAVPSLVLLPQWFSTRGIRNRKVVADAFQRYFLNGHHEYASALVKDLYTIECPYGFSPSDRSFLEVGNAFASLSNTYAAVFWLTFHVFSSPAALRRIRKEVSGITTTSMNKTRDNQTFRHTLDITKVNSHCPFLVSTFKETLRLHSADISLRQVCKDTVLDNTYYLKKGAMIVIPSTSIHTDSRIWGPDVLSFIHDRFLPTKVSATQRKKVSPAALRSFGGGASLCPGRHLATNQIMIWISMLVMCFDIEPTSGSWDQPATDKSNMPSSIMSATHDVEVRFTPRQFYNDGVWDLRTSKSEATLSLTAEDLADDPKVE